MKMKKLLSVLCSVTCATCGVSANFKPGTNVTVNIKDLISKLKVVY